MTLKKKAFWFVGLPFMGVVLWTSMYAIVAHFDKRNYGIPDCKVSIEERTDVTASKCAEDDELIYGPILMMDFMCAGLFGIGVVIFMIFVLVHFLQKNSKKK